jgi:hypothetical protein
MIIILGLIAWSFLLFYLTQIIIVTSRFLTGDFFDEPVKDFLLQYIPFYWFFKMWKEEWENLDHKSKTRN